MPAPRRSGVLAVGSPDGRGEESQGRSSVLLSSTARLLDSARPSSWLVSCLLMAGHHRPPGPLASPRASLCSNPAGETRLPAPSFQVSEVVMHSHVGLWGAAGVHLPKPCKGSSRGCHSLRLLRDIRSMRRGAGGVQVCPLPGALPACSGCGSLRLKCPPPGQPGRRCRQRDLLPSLGVLCEGPQLRRDPLECALRNCWQQHFTFEQFSLPDSHLHRPDPENTP